MIYAINKQTREHANVTDMHMPFVANYINRDVWHLVGADDDGWIEWQGGECPLPEGHLCDVKHRDGELCEGVPAGVAAIPVRSNAEFWSHSAIMPSGDIIAYRPILSEPGAGAPEWAIGERCIWQLGDVCMGEHTILAKDGDTYWIRDDHGGYDMADREELRPIRTPEDEAVKEMVGIVGDFDHNEGVCRALYRAGYRRQAEEEV